MMTKVSSEGVKCLQCSDWAVPGSVPPLCRRHTGAKSITVRSAANGDEKLFADKKGGKQCQH